MVQDNLNSSFDPKAFIDSIIEEMGMQNEAPEKLAMLKGYMERQLDHVISRTASETLEPEVIDKVLEEYGETKDIGFLFEKCVQDSVDTQWAIVKALEEFKDQTINAYLQIKR